MKMNEGKRADQMKHCNFLSVLSLVADSNITLLN